MCIRFLTILKYTSSHPSVIIFGFVWDFRIHLCSRSLRLLLVLIQYRRLSIIRYHETLHRFLLSIVIQSVRLFVSTQLFVVTCSMVIRFLSSRRSNRFLSRGSGRLLNSRSARLLSSWSARFFSRLVLVVDISHPVPDILRSGLLLIIGLNTSLAFSCHITQPVTHRHQSKAVQQSCYGSCHRSEIIRLVF